MSYLWDTPEKLEAIKREQQVKTAAARLAAFRRRRDVKLAECDWTQLPDAPLTPEQKAAWADYRQALRDVPETATADGWVVWPTKPA